jgi:molecular chaperone GrpE
MSEREVVPEPESSTPAGDQKSTVNPEMGEPTLIEPEIELLPTLTPEQIELESLRAELKENTARLRTVSVAYRSLKEDFGAFRVRQERQTAAKQEVLKGDTVKRLFEPMENLRRSIDSLVKTNVSSDELNGLEMVWRDFLSGFQDLGLEELGHKGDVFDPDLHEALTLMPVDDPALDGKVIEVFSKGFRVGTRLIRPARVVIGQHHEEPIGEA